MSTQLIPLKWAQLLNVWFPAYELSTRTWAGVTPSPLKVVASASSCIFITKWKLRHVHRPQCPTLMHILQMDNTVVRKTVSLLIPSYLLCLRIFILDCLIRIIRTLTVCICVPYHVTDRVFYNIIILHVKMVSIHIFAALCQISLFCVMILSNLQRWIHILFFVLLCWIFLQYA